MYFFCNYTNKCFIPTGFNPILRVEISVKRGRRFDLQPRKKLQPADLNADLLVRSPLNTCTVRVTFKS